jgi:hypothetical protein
MLRTGEVAIPAPPDPRFGFTKPLEKDTEILGGHVDKNSVLVRPDLTRETPPQSGDPGWLNRMICNCPQLTLTMCGDCYSFSKKSIYG